MSKVGGSVAGVAGGVGDGVMGLGVAVAHGGGVVACGAVFLRVVDGVVLTFWGAFDGF